MQPSHFASSYRAYTAPIFSAGLLFILLPPSPAAAFNAVTVDAGYGLEDTKLLRFNYAIGDRPPKPAENGWAWRHFWEANLSYWYLYKNTNGEDGLFELGLTPNLRSEPEQPWSWGRPYWEAGLGVHLLSKVHIGTRDLGSAFHFGTHVGFGLRFGDKEQWDLAWRFEHLSNGGLKEPNPGINFSMIRFGYHW